MKTSFRRRKFLFPRKSLLPIFLIIFLLGSFFWAKFRQTDWSFDLVQSGEILNPLPSPTAKEELENFLRQGGLTPTNLDFQDEQVEGSFSGNLTVFFSLDKDLFSQVISLQFILSRSKIEGKLPKLVDLRFRKPVISY